MPSESFSPSVIGPGYPGGGGPSIDPYPVLGETMLAGGDSGPQAFLNADARASVAPNGKPSLTIDQAASQIVRGQPGWSATLGTPFTVTYAYRASAPGSMPDDSGGFQRFNAAQIDQAELALKGWSDVANIHFVRVGSGDSGAGAYSDNAAILFGDYTTGVDGAAAFTLFPGSTSPSSAAGDVWVNSTLSYNIAPTVGNYGGQVLVHELGHAIGLDHPSDYNADANTVITYAANASYYEDSRQYTVMSYFSEANTGGNDGGVYSAAPLLDDIAAAQLEYGANMTTRTGDTVYGFHSTAGEPWYALTSSASRALFAVWDAGGKDTLDFSGFGQAQTIDLRPGFFSSVGGLTGNVVIAEGANIENAIGGSGPDSITGNALDNNIVGGGGADIIMAGAGNDSIDGGPGNDAIDGGAGVDLASYAAVRSSVVLSYSANTLHLTDLTAGSPGGTDNLSNVEYLSFAGVTMSVDRALLPTNAAIGDYDGDGKADILWRNQASGVSVIWQMNGMQQSAGNGTDTSAGAPWTILGTGDFNGDGKADILWRNDTSGTTVVWTEDGTHQLAQNISTIQAGNDWYVAGIADFNGDGKADLLWRNLDSNATVVWTMNGATVTTAAITDVFAGSEWAVAGSGDFNGDGKADILWRNTADGSTVIWEENGAHQIAAGYTTGVVGLPWTVAGVADFNGDGKADILWRNVQTSETAIWTMNGATLVGSAFTDAFAPQGWSIAGTGDFNGDGKADILWRNDTTQQTVVWEMNGAHVIGSGFTDAFAPSGWVFT